MEKRKLGTTGSLVSPLCFGGNVFGWTIDEPTSFELLDAFTDAGHNFIDTADVYSRWAPGNKGGESERIIGDWFKKSGKRKEVVLATKVGADMGDGKKLKKAYILKCVEDSLSRLQTDYIDLYQSHYQDLETNQEETLLAYDELVKSGKVLAIGASNHSKERLIEAASISAAHHYPAYATLQPLYNLYDRADYEQNYAGLVADKDLAVIPYYSLASGFLTGKYRSEADLGKSARGQGVKKYLDDRGFRILAALDEVAAGHKATPAMVSLAWLLTRPGITAPIVSATNLDQLNDLFKSVSLELSENDVTLLNEASAY